MEKPFSRRKLNENSASVRRILQEIRELEGSKEVAATPREDNIFEWHFTIRGVPGSEFNGGRYHGKIFLPPQYPFRPPSFRFCHENGRFSVNKDICLNISSFHEELWQPVWGIHTALISLSNFMLTRADGHIGGLDFTENEKKKIALQSREWICPECNKRNIDLLPDLENEFETFSHSDIPKLCFAYKDDNDIKKNKIHIFFSSTKLFIRRWFSFLRTWVFSSAFMEKYEIIPFWIDLVIALLVVVLLSIVIRRFFL